MWERLRARLSSISAKSHAGGIVLILLSGFLLLWKLGNWTAGLSPAEAAAEQASHSYGSIINNPLNAPQKLLQALTQSTGWHSFFNLRLASALITLGLIITFYLVVRKWFGKQAGLFASVFLLSTPWLLIASRQATATALLIGLVLPVAAYVWFSQKPASRWRWHGLFAAISLSLYVPAMFWFLLVGVWLVRKQLSKLFKLQTNALVMSGIGLLVILLLPLIVGLVKQPHLIKDWLAIPSSLGSPVDVLKHLAWAVGGLFWQTGSHFELGVGRWPLLNIAQLVISFFGAYALWDKARPLFYSLLTVIGLAVLASGLNDSPALLLLALPSFGILMAAGLRYLYIEWRTVFPRNPIPQTAALVLISALAAIQFWYGLHYSLTVWPHTTDTKSVYMIK